jgi:hypothetical protein
MDKDLIIGLTIGLAVAAAGGAAWYFTQQKPTVNKPGAVVGAVTPAGSSLTNGNDYGTRDSFQTVAGPTSQDVLNQLKAQQEAEQRRLRDLEIRAFQDRIGAVENAQALKISEIDSINRDDSRLNDFITQAYREKHAEACQGWDPFGVCAGSVDAFVRRPENTPSGGQKLRAWQASTRFPAEQKLKELEVQYRGMVNELQARFSVTYNPSQPNAHAQAAQV